MPQTLLWKLDTSFFILISYKHKNYKQEQEKEIKSDGRKMPQTILWKLIASLLYYSLFNTVTSLAQKKCRGKELEMI